MYIKSLVLALLLCCTTVSAQIITTADLQQIKSAVFASKADTLVLFDVDLVLIMPSEQVFLKCIDKESIQFLTARNDRFEQIYGKQAADDLQSVILLAGTTRTVSADTTQFINEIKTRGYKTLGLTLSGTGRFGKIASMEQWRINELKSHGIVFNAGLPDVKAGGLEAHLHPEIKKFATNHHCSPGVESDIVFTCYHDKGSVLGTYLFLVEHKPNKIIFVDDRRDNLESVAKYCQQHGIEFLGFEYTAAIEHAKSLTFNQQLAQIQYSLLEHANIWLDDNTAQKILDSM